MVKKITRTLAAAKSELKKRDSRGDKKSGIYKISSGRYIIGTRNQAMNEFASQNKYKQY